MFRRLFGAVSLTALVAAAPASADDLAQGATFHGDAARSGNFLAAGLTWSSGATMHRATGFAGTTTGNISAQPLYWRASGAAHGMVVVATDQNVVQAFDASTGASLWSRSLGTPDTDTVPDCGSPRQQGVSGTPVIDAANGLLYVASSVRTSSGIDRFEVWSISLSDGSVQQGWPLMLSVALRKMGFGFVSIIHDQHTALALSGGQVFAGFAANSGDCGAYHGYIVAIDASAPKLSAAWEARGGRAGIWSQAGISSDGSSLFAATGNGTEPRGWRDGEAVMRLQSGLAHVSRSQDYFVPTNFHTLDDDDLDLGGASPVPVDVPRASGGPAQYLFQIGKDGVGRVLNRANLGGIGPDLAELSLAVAPVVTVPATFNDAGGTTVVVTGEGTHCPGSSPNARGLLAARLTSSSGPTLQFRWCAALAGASVPIVTTTDGKTAPTIWILSVGGDNRLHGYRGDTGAVVFGGGGNGDVLQNLQHHAAILVAEDRLFVGDGNVLKAFDYTPGQ